MRMCWIPMIVFLTLALASHPLVPAWAFMWSLAAALFFGFKWLTWCRAAQRRASPNVARSLAYLFLWPGMDAETFLSQRAAKQPKADLWFWGAANAVVGI